MTPVELVLSKLPDAKRNGKGWAARCPAHEDKRPSLSITEGDNGGALVHCHAGCPPEEIVAALGVTLADLMPATPTTARPMPRLARKLTANATARPPATFTTAAEAVAELERQHGPRAAAWTYHGADGEPVGLVVRWNRPDGEKDIRPVSRTPGAWIIGGMPEPRPLYRLPELLAKPRERVLICEGEKATDAAAGLGYLATTSPHGCKSASKADWTPLAGREVVILPDHDEAGQKYAGDVAGILAKLTPPATVRVARLPDAWPDLPGGGDIADVVEAGEDADAIKAKLAALVDAAEPEAPAAPALAVEPFKPFPTDALPEVLRGFVMELAAATGNDPACAALAALVVLGGAIGNRVAAQVKRGWIEATILWGAIVARSGTTKSAVLKLATRALVEMYKEARQQFAEDLAAYEAERQRHEVEQDRWKAAQKKGAGPCDPPVEPEPPTERRLMVSDVTCEKLGVLLQDNPLGLLLVRDELAAWIGAFDRYAAGGKGSDAPAWLSFFDAAPVVIDRKSAAGTIFVERASVSVLGSIQPGTLRRVFGVAERESGLLARLLLVQPPTQPVVWTDEELSEATATDWANLLRALMEIQPGTDDQGKPRPRLIPLATDAKPVYVAWHNAHGRDVADIHAEDLAAHFAKLKGICIRLGLLFACVDAVTTGQPVAAIGRDPIERAIAVTDWFKGEARRVYGALGEDDEERDRRRLVELIGRKGGSISGRELVQSSRAYRMVDDANAALEDLASSGYGTWQTPEQRGPGGPKARRFVLAPAYGVNVYSNAAADSASGESVDVDSVDAAKAKGADWGEV
jgi:hypothetical protein